LRPNLSLNRTARRRRYAPSARGRLAWFVRPVCEIRTLGPLALQLFTAMKGEVSFSDFCAPAATVEFAANNGLLENDLVLFKLSYPGYELEARAKDGMIFVRRNGLYQHSEQYKGKSRLHVAVQWEVNSIACGVAPWTGNSEAMNQDMRAVRTPPTVPPPELVRTLRTHNLLTNSAYRSSDDFFATALDCLHLCEVDIRKFGGERFAWGKGGDPKRPLDEPEISRYVATFLASHGAARNFDVTCEAIAGSGNSDFWLVGPVASAGLAKIAIEAKKADNPNLVRGFTIQLPEYMARLGANHGIFLTYWLKSENYPHPHHRSYQELEIAVLHPLPRRPGVRSVGLNLSNGPTPSHASA
jgi:hypothetical protein